MTTITCSLQAKCSLLKASFARCRLAFKAVEGTVCREVDFAVHLLAAIPRRSIMSVWNTLILTACLVGGIANSASAGHISHLCCVNQTICDQTCFACEPSCEHFCNQRRRCCVSRWCQLHCLDSTCDMHPHYAYDPENHGYYYFRPYNWQHYAEDTSRMLGMGYAAPYSENGFRELKPATLVQQPVLIPPRSKKSLPDLEDLLRK